MNTNLDLNHWLEIKDIKDAETKIITDGEFNSTTTKDVELLNKYLSFDKNDTVLDFGCGIGRLAKPISLMVKEVLAVDISEAMIRYGLMYCKGIPNIYFKPMTDETRIDIIENGVDKMYSLLVLQHIEKAKVFRILFEIGNVLKIGGLAFLQFPNIEQEEYLDYLIKRSQLGSASVLLEFYSENELRRMFKSVGLSVIDIMNTNKDFYVLVMKNMKTNSCRNVGIMPI